MSASARTRFDALHAALNREPAPPEALPPLLREPPWLKADRPRQPALEIAPIATPERIVWPPERLAQAEQLATRTYRYAGESVLELLYTQGTAAIPECVRQLLSHDGRMPWLALMLDTPALVPSMLHLLRNVRLRRANATQWLLAYPHTALMGALPLAFAPAHGATRDDARHGIRWLAAHGHADTARKAAAAYGGAMPGALDLLLASDPLDAVPDTLPPLPPFFTPRAFRKPELRSGGALPVEAVEHVARMLAIGAPDAPYAGIALLKEACTPGSLAEFAWDLFEAWLAAEAPASGRWAFGALAQLGDAETAARLATRIRQWAAEDGMRGRAADGLDILAALGSDAALTRIHAIASKGPHKRTRVHAQEVLGRIARSRGLDWEQLEDRIAPTLGLEEPGSEMLDFGPRHFLLCFDEGLVPRVRDAQGRRLADLPKPNKDDDKALATAAVERFKQLRKEARAVASLQVTRLERAMVQRRRWPLAEFRTFFVEHPVLRHLASRIVWGNYEGDRLVQAFRVAEDGSFASSADEGIALPEDASIGIPHPLELPASELPALGQLLADYEVLQPFRQFARETYALAPAERGQQKLDRFRDRDVATGAVIGLEQKGWERSRPQDGGMICDFSREGVGGLHVSIQFSPGIFVAGRSHEPRQTLCDLLVYRSLPASGPVTAAATFDELDPIFLSEALRDIDLLNPRAAETP